MRGRDHTQVDHYDGLRPRKGPPWLESRRDTARAALREHGFPGRKDEDWWNTPTRALLAQAFALPSQPTAVDMALPDGPRVVLVDGQLDAARSRLVPGVRSLGTALDGVAGHLGALLNAPTGFDALNTALAEEGAVVEVDAVGGIGEPVHLVHVCTGGDRLGLARHVVRVADGAEVTVVEHWLGSGGQALTGGVTEVTVGEGATVRWVKVQRQQAEAHHVGTLAVDVAAGGRFEGHSIAMGSAISRTDLRVRLAGASSSCALSGLALLKHRQHTDHHVLVDHDAPHCTSTQVFRSILADRAHSVFTGKVVVREGAQKTDSAQSNNSLLLSDTAIASSRPQLEIYADDVACQHGATVGRLDDEALFYLRVRGLDQLQARALLIGAFASEVLLGVPDDVRALVAQPVHDWLEEVR